MLTSSSSLNFPILLGKCDMWLLVRFSICNFLIFPIASTRTSHKMNLCGNDHQVKALLWIAGLLLNTLLPGHCAMFCNDYIIGLHIIEVLLQRSIHNHVCSRIAKEKATCTLWRWNTKYTNTGDGRVAFTLPSIYSSCYPYWLSNVNTHHFMDNTKHNVPNH